eukprot:m.149279 g.149279  ORF g.149279 m.149279 type:complete len:58 (-) comp9729_c0_seq1:60-233(-)
MLPRRPRWRLTTLRQLASETVVTLRQLCKDRKLPVSGNKETLVQRLRESGFPAPVSS